MKKKLTAFLALAICLVMLGTAAAEADAQITVLPDAKSTTYTIDPMDQTKQYYSGLCEGTAELEDGTQRTYKIYCPAGVRRDVCTAFVAVPGGMDTAEFLEKSGWIALAEEQQIILYVFEPADGVWGDDATEAGYFAKAYSALTSNTYFYADIFDWRWVGYGAGGRLMQMHVMKNPLLCAGMVVVDGSGDISDEYVQAAGDEYIVYSSRGTTTTFDMQRKQIPVPVWMIEKELTDDTARIAEYWKAANDCTGDSIKLAEGTLYPQNPLSMSPITYDQKVGQVIVTEKTADYCDPAFTEAAWHFVRSFERGGTGSPYSNCLTAAVQDESIWKQENLVVDGINREWFTYLPTGYSEDGEPLPVVIYLHGNGQSGLLSMRQGDWWKIGEKKGFITVCPSGALLDQKNKVPIMNWNASTDSKQTADDIKFFREMVAKLIEEYNVDAGRIYITGQSNGAGMASRLALQAPELFAACAVMGSAASYDEEGRPVDSWGTYEISDEADIPMYLLFGEFDGTKAHMELEGNYRTQLNIFLEKNGLKFEDMVSYTNGRYTHYFWFDENGVPMARWTISAKRTHSHRPDENDIFWDEYFCMFARDTETGKILYMGK